jgi:UDP-3-O-[3-hydroxymyristoyl] glucosamine N-acyltransferase
MIAHNCVIGEDTAIAAQAGLSGSTTVGRRVTIGGQVGVAGHVTIPDETIVAAQSGLISSPDEAGTYVGYPALKGPGWFRLIAEASRLRELRRLVEAIQERIDRLEKMDPSVAQEREDLG